MPREYTDEISIAEPPVPREETPFKRTFVVPSLERVRQGAERTGGLLKPEQAAWRFRGCFVLDGWDPEGNVVQSNRPSEVFASVAE